MPTRQGFDYFFGYLHQGHAHNYYPESIIENEARVLLKNKVPEALDCGAGVATVRVDYSPKLMLEKSLAFIDAHKNEPFFLYLPYTLPHANNEKRMATGDGTEVPDFGEYADKDWTVLGVLRKRVGTSRSHGKMEGPAPSLGRRLYRNIRSLKPLYG
jgi:hypothetical protein